MNATNGISQQVADYRQRHNVSRAAMASHLGVSEAAVGSWERGRRAPTGEHLQALEQLLSGPPPATLTATKATPKKAAAKKAAAKKAPSKKATAKKAPAKKAPAKKAAAKAPATKAPAAKASAGAVGTSKRVPAKRPPAKRTASKAPAKRPTEPAAPSESAAADESVVLVISGAGEVTVEPHGPVRLVNLDLSELRRAGRDDKATIAARLSADLGDLPGQLLARALHRIADLTGRH